MAIYAQHLGAKLPPNLGLGTDRQPYIAVDQPCLRRSRSSSDVRALDFALRATAGQQPYHFRFDVQILGVVATSIRPVQVLIGMAQTLFVQLAVWKVVPAFSGPQRPTASCLIYKERKIISRISPPICVISRSPQQGWQALICISRALA